jgi:hypothetical protein
MENPDEINLVTVKTNYNTLAYIPDYELRKTIFVKVKTFFGQRKTFTFEVDISSQVKELANKAIIAAGENIKSFYGMRLLYPNGGDLKDVGVGNGTFQQFQIVDNSKLIMLVQTIFTWDTVLKAPLIKLSNNNLTAF